MLVLWRWAPLHSASLRLTSVHAHYGHRCSRLPDAKYILHMCTCCFRKQSAWRLHVNAATARGRRHGCSTATAVHCVTPAHLVPASVRAAGACCAPTVPSRTSLPARTATTSRWAARPSCSTTLTTQPFPAPVRSCCCCACDTVGRGDALAARVLRRAIGAVIALANAQRGCIYACMSM